MDLPLWKITICNVARNLKNQSSSKVFFNTRKIQFQYTGLYKFKSTSQKNHKCQLTVHHIIGKGPNLNTISNLQYLDLNQVTNKNTTSENHMFITHNEAIKKIEWEITLVNTIGQTMEMNIYTVFFKIITITTDIWKCSDNSV